MPPGEVKVAKITGRVTMTVNGVTTDLVAGAMIPPTAKVNTQNGASTVLAFSNGATTQLGPDTELVIEEFLVDPFGSEIKIADITDEPSSSHTKLALNRGELVGNVKHLNKSKGSTFSVQTPVGAAGIRGTTFRIVFRPNGTGQAFFQLSTVEGNVGFTQPDANGGGTPATGATTTVTGTGTAGVAVPQGQEVSITVDVSTNAQGQLVVTVLPPPVTTTSNVSVATMQAVTQVAQDIAVAVQQTVFTPTVPPAPNPPANSPPAETNKPATETTTTTTTVSGSNFTADLEVTTSPPPVQPQRIVTNGGGTSGG